jgi:hypothetical protein
METVVRCRRQGRICLVFACWSAFFSVAAFGQEKDGARSWKPGDIQLEYSRVFVLVDKSGVVGHQHAVEGKLQSGRLSPRREDAGKLVFDMKSFDADGPAARRYLGLEGTTDDATRKKVNENMLGEEILSVQKFPEAKLENAILTATGKKSTTGKSEYLLRGDFTLHRATRPVEIRCEVEEKDGWHHIRGAFKILQSDYGIKPFSKMLGAVGVKDELLIVGDLWMVPSP